MLKTEAGEDFMLKFWQEKILLKMYDGLMFIDIAAAILSMSKFEIQIPF